MLTQRDHIAQPGGARNRIWAGETWPSQVDIYLAHPQSRPATLPVPHAHYEYDEHGCPQGLRASPALHTPWAGAHQLTLRGAADSTAPLQLSSRPVGPTRVAAIHVGMGSLHSEGRGYVRIG